MCRRAINDWTATQDLARDIVQNVFQQFSLTIRKGLWLGDLRRFRKPEAWFTHVARNEIASFKREQARRWHGERPRRLGSKTGSSTKVRFAFRYAHELPKLPRIEDEDGLKMDAFVSAVDCAFVNRRRSPEEFTFDREIVQRYLTALGRLPTSQRVAFVLYKDVLLQPEEQALVLGVDKQLLEKIRNGSRPDLRIGDIAALLGRRSGTLSSDLTRAKAALRKDLLNLRWRPPTALPIPKRPREFLVGFSGHRGSIRSFRVRMEDCGTLKPSPLSLCAGDLEYVRRISDLKHRDSALVSKNYKATNAYSLDMVPGWVKAPEQDDPSHAELLKTIGDLLKRRKRFTTITKVLNTTQVAPRFGTTWHHTAVELIARRAGLVGPIRTRSNSSTCH